MNSSKDEFLRLLKKTILVYVSWELPLRIYSLIIHKNFTKENTIFQKNIKYLIKDTLRWKILGTILAENFMLTQFPKK